MLRNDKWPQSTWLAVLLTLEVLAWAVVQTPAERFVRYIAFDSGVDLTMQDLMARGFRPMVDFACVYGLLPLLINRVWYGLAGLTPGAFRVEAVLGVCLLAWGLARFARARRFGAAGIALVVLAIPDVSFLSTMTVVHVLEPAILVHALAEQARGRRAAALALATAACFIKPALGYVYGACLLVWIVSASRGKGRSYWVRSLLPAAAVALALGALVAAAFGVGPLLETIVPTRATSVYRINRTGFFTGRGSEFWAWPPGGFLNYFRYEVGFWVLGSLWLVWSGLAALVRLARGRSVGADADDDELAVTCATLHVVFVTCMFGLRTSWTYYFAVLILGLAVRAKRDRTGLVTAWCLAALLLVNDRSKLMQFAHEWRTASPSAETLGLWAAPDQRAEWLKVLELSRDERPVLLAWIDGAVPLTPRFAPPVAGYVWAGLPLPVEVHRKAEQIRSARLVVAVVHRDREQFAEWPELAAALDGCELVFDGATFRVYRRVRPPGDGPVAR